MRGPFFGPSSRDVMNPSLRPVLGSDDSDHSLPACSQFWPTLSGRSERHSLCGKPLPELTLTVKPLCEEFCKWVTEPNPANEQSTSFLRRLPIPDLMRYNRISR